jgi:hypothetical protein
MIKSFAVAFLVTCLIILSACDNSPAALARNAAKTRQKEELFLKCVELATRNVKIYDTGDAVTSCRNSVNTLI